MVTTPTLIRGACSKQASLQLSLDMLNTAFKQIQPIAATNVTHRSEMSLHMTRASRYPCSHQHRSMIRARHSISSCVHRGPKVSLQLRCPSSADVSILSASNDAFDSFAALADMFDDLDHQLDHIYTRFETLPIPSIWLQSPLFDWKQVCPTRVPTFNSLVHRPIWTSRITVGSYATSSP